MVLLRSRDHRTHTNNQTAQKNTNQNAPTHTHKKKERRASACGFPNPNSVVELKGGRRASVFSFFFFSFLAKLRQILT
jgi:hypothetical protein